MLYADRLSSVAGAQGKGSHVASICIWVSLTGRVQNVKERSNRQKCNKKVRAFLLNRALVYNRTFVLNSAFALNTALGQKGVFHFSGITSFFPKKVKKTKKAFLLNQYSTVPSRPLRPILYGTLASVFFTIYVASAETLQPRPEPIRRLGGRPVTGERMNRVGSVDLHSIATLVT